MTNHLKFGSKKIENDLKKKLLKINNSKVSSWRSKK